MVKPTIPLISDDLRISIGDRAVKLSPSDGLHLAENLTRLSFRRLLIEEAENLHGRKVGQPKSARRARRGS